MYQVVSDPDRSEAESGCHEAEPPQQGRGEVQRHFLVQSRMVLGNEIKAKLSGYGNDLKTSRN